MSPRFVVELNGASASELRALPDVGVSLAGRIIATRERLGGFQQVEQLRDVPGVGPKTIERLRPMLVVDDALLTRRQYQETGGQSEASASPERHGERALAAPVVPD